MRKILSMFCILCFLLFVSWSCNEDTVKVDLYGAIIGSVVDEDGSPIEGVSVYTNPGTSAVLTDSDGEYSLGDVKVGSYAVSFKKNSYASQAINVSVDDGKLQKVSVVLSTGSSTGSLPSSIKNVYPLDASLNVLSNVKLAWKNGNSSKGDTLYFDVVLFNGGDDFVGSLVVENLLDTTFVLSDLMFETSYRWQVIARNKSREKIEGALWKFKTESFPKNNYFFVKDTLDSNLDIYSSDLDSTHLVRLSSKISRQLSPRLSPNKELLAYTSNQADGTYHIHTMSVKGKNKTDIQKSSPPVVSYHGDGSGFCWSPTGAYLLYTNNSKLYRINKDGSGLTLISTAPADRHYSACSWSKANATYPSKILALTQGENAYDNEIYIMDTNGGNAVEILSNVAGVLGSPSFSVSGSLVFFTQDIAGHNSYDGRRLDSRVHRMNLDGTDIKDLSGGKIKGTNDFSPSLSPDGSKIIFMNMSNTGFGRKDVWIMDVTGGHRKLILENAQMPEWAQAVYN